ncbi:hypothetical protein DEM27_05655 [Metarhizobium album]|uniref:Uncharacterized protein n=2 Tax=Metarhizobium album TaxID=2182425 RepID=A0A2U2DV03_9HYPH|nr:hypothetical protein DEM27_05655 [Rhizobium album]
MDPLAVAGEQASTSPRVKPKKRSFWWTFRIRVVLRFARLMRVPIDVHNSYFNDGRYANKAKSADKAALAVVNHLTNHAIDPRKFNEFVQDVKDDLKRPRPVDGGKSGPEAA